MKIRHFTHKNFFLMSLVLCILTLSACSLFQPSKTKLNLKAATSIKLNLQSYNASFFTMKIPAGWTIETIGEYESFGFKLYDPKKPSRQIFYYGSMTPFMKSLAGRQAWQTYLNMGGYSSAKIYVDVPYLDSATTAGFFYKFDDFAQVANQYGIDHDFPILNNLEIIQRVDRNSPMKGVAVDDAIVRGLFTQDGAACEGLFAATVVDSATQYMYEADAGYYTVYVIMGISAPADEFAQLEATLESSIASFQFKQAYIDEAVQQNKWKTDAALQVGKTLSEAADSYNQAWKDRQPADDALSQKRSDGMLGFDRLYDSETGKTYRSELGFYDNYDTNRNEYANPNLQLIPSNGYDYYSKGVSGTIYK